MSGVSNRDVVFNAPSAHLGPIINTAKCGYHRVSHTPSSTSDAIYTNTMRITETNLEGFSMQGSAHGIAGYDMSVINGNGSAPLMVGHESKLIMNGTGTISMYSFYKPAIDVIEGTITTMAMLDCEMSLSAINGSIPSCYSVYSPDTDKLMLQNGGFITDTIVLVDDYTLDSNDSGNTFLMFAGATKSVTVPSSLPDGFHCYIMQGDSNQVTISASGGNTIFNKEGQSKTEKAYAMVMVRQVSSAITSLSGETGA